MGIESGSEVADLSMRAFQDGWEIGHRLAAVQNGLLAGQGIIDASGFTYGDDPGSIVRASPAVAEVCVGAVLAQAERGKLQDRLLGLQSQLAEMLVGRAVTVAPIRDGASPIVGMKYYDSDFTNRHGWRRSPQQPVRAIGSVAALDVTTGTMDITPRRYSRTWPAMPQLFVVAVLNEHGQPDVTLSVRKQGFRDRQSLLERAAVVLRPGTG